MNINDYRDAIRQLCVNHKVKSLYVFGSVLTNQFRADSDVDLIVDIDTTDPIDYAENYFGLKFSLADLLERPIDLLEQKALTNTYLIERINTTKQMLYETSMA